MGVSTKKKNSNLTRLDGTPKGTGHLGPIRNPYRPGDIVTEYSVGIPKRMDPKRPKSALFRPSIHKGIHPTELNYTLATGNISSGLAKTSLRAAEKRRTKGLSPFKNDIYKGKK